MRYHTQVKPDGSEEEKNQGAQHPLGHPRISGSAVSVVAVTECGHLPRIMGASQEREYPTPQRRSAKDPQAVETLIDSDRLSHVKESGLPNLLRK